MSKGYVKLYRKSLESAVFQNANLWKVWCYCLMRANHAPTNILWNGEERPLRPGQFITGRFQAAGDCNMKPSTLWYQLRFLKKMSNIDIVSDNKSSLITVTNWRKYQWTEGGSDTGLDTGLTTNRQGIDTDKNGRMKENVEVPVSDEPKACNEAQSLYDYYATWVCRGKESESLSSISRLLGTVPATTLRASVDRYVTNDMPGDVKYRIRPHNFFGANARYKTYLPQQPGNEIQVASGLRQLVPGEEGWL